MNWDLFNGINLFGIFAVFTVGGFFIGYLMGYIWARLDQRKVINTLGLNGSKTPRSNYYIHSTNLQDSLKGRPIKFHSMPVGYQPWKQTREYAKGA